MMVSVLRVACVDLAVLSFNRMLAGVGRRLEDGDVVAGAHEDKVCRRNAHGMSCNGGPVYCRRVATSLFSSLSPGVIPRRSYPDAVHIIVYEYDVRARAVVLSCQLVTPARHVRMVTSEGRMSEIP